MILYFLILSSSSFRQYSHWHAKHRYHLLRFQVFLLFLQDELWLVYIFFWTLEKWQLNSIGLTNHRKSCKNPSLTAYFKHSCILRCNREILFIFTFSSLGRMIKTSVTWSTKRIFVARHSFPVPTRHGLQEIRTHNEPTPFPNGFNRLSDVTSQLNQR